MARAWALALKSCGHTRPNPPVGAVVVQDGRIVGEFDAESVSFNELGLYMSGAKEMKQLAGEGGNA